MLKTKILLPVILLIALFLRVYKLDTVPIELFGDEIDVGLQAYSILKTGNDYYGYSLPLMFQSFNEYRLPVFIYSAVPFVASFGLNEWGVRLPSVFWGMLGIIAVFLLTRRLINIRVALIVSLFLAFTPWHIHFSRQGGIESLVIFTVLCFALWTFLKGLEQFNWLIVAAFLFGVSFYTYAIAALFVPLFGLVLILLYFKKIISLGFKKIFILAVIFGLVLLPFITLTIQGKTTARSSRISILNDRQLNDDIVYRRKVENKPDSRFWHNKLWTFSSEITQNYFEILSPKFLFFEGDPNLTHSTARGVLYFSFVIALIFGVVSLSKGKLSIPLILSWLILAPLPAAITLEGGHHASRAVLILLPLIIISGMGIDYLFDRRKSKLFGGILVIFLILTVFNIAFYLHRYYNDWRVDSWRFWHLGYKEAITYIKSQDSNYSKIYFNNSYEPALPRFLFYYKYDPADFQKKFIIDKPKDNIALGYNGFIYDNKYYFGSFSENDKYAALDKLLQRGEIYMVSALDEASLADWRINPPGTIKVLKTVVNPYNVPIFYVVTKRD